MKFTPPLAETESAWTPVTGYVIRIDGSIISLRPWRGQSERIINWADDRSGYPVVRMVDEFGRRRKFKVHQLVCIAFHGPRPSLESEVRHLDGNPMNNHAKNLRWGTKSENAKDRVRHGTQFMPPWDDPTFREKVVKAMRGSKARKAKARGES